MLPKTRICLDSLSVDDIDARLKALSRAAVWHLALGALAGYAAWRGYAALEEAQGSAHSGDVFALVLLMVLAVSLWVGAWGDLRELFRFEAQVMGRVPVGRAAPGETNFMRDFREDVRQEKD